MFVTFSRFDLAVTTPVDTAGRAFLERDLEQADVSDSVERAQAERRRVARRRDMPLAGVVSVGRALIRRGRLQLERGLPACRNWSAEGTPTPRQRRLAMAMVSGATPIDGAA